MRSIFILVFLCLVASSLNAQTKKRTLWVSGSSSRDTEAVLEIQYDSTSGEVLAFEVRQRGFDDHDFTVTITPEGGAPRTLEQRGGRLVLGIADLFYRELTDRERAELPFAVPPGTRVPNFDYSIRVTLAPQFRDRSRS